MNLISCNEHCCKAYFLSLLYFLNKDFIFNLFCQSLDNVMAGNSQVIFIAGKPTSQELIKKLDALKRLKIFENADNLIPYGPYRITLRPPVSPRTTPKQYANLRMISIFFATSRGPRDLLKLKLYIM